MSRSKRPSKQLMSMLGELSNASLEDMAGAAVYERGVGYVAEGRARLVGEDGVGAMFEVTGTQAYTVELHFEDSGLHVACDCPHGQDGNFCKHLVAAALLWRAHLGGDAPPPHEKPAKSARAVKAAETRAARRERLEAFVRAQPAEQLADRLWKWAQHDSDLLADLKAWAASERANDDPKALRQAVSDLMSVSTSRIMYGRAVWSWAERARQVEPLLRRWLAQAPEVARGIAEHALRRVYAASQYVDDSDGEVGGVMQMLIEFIVETVRAAPPPAAWAKTLMELLDEDPFGLWNVAHVLEVAGESVASAFSERIARRWAEVSRAKKSDFERDRARTRVRDLMLIDLRRRGDVAAELDFMKLSARDLFEHAQLIESFERHGRHREAIQLAQAACKKFDNHAIVEDLLLKAYGRDGWDEEAWQIRQRRFASRPSVENYQALLDAAAEAKKDIDVVRGWAYEQAGRVVDPVASKRARSASASGARDGRVVSTTVAMLLHDGELARALELVKAPNTCHPHLLEALASRLPRSQDTAAFALLDRIVRSEMQTAQTPYTVALRTVSLALARLTSREREGYLARLKSEYKAKRNFVRGLP